MPLAPAQAAAARALAVSLCFAASLHSPAAAKPAGAEARPDQFSLGNPGSGACQAGYTVIRSVGMCAAASANLGLVYDPKISMSASSGDATGLCSLCGGCTGRPTYFQPAQVGASSLQQWVCQATGAQCPTKTGVLKNWPKTVLASYPGSGSTLLRLLIEQATGVLTGTVFKDPSLLSSQPCVRRARARAWCSAPASPRTATAALTLSCEQWKGAARARNHAWAVHTH